MAQFSYEDADKYGGNGGHGFFSLKDDHDTARVRFMYNSMGDVIGMSVHEVEIDGKKKYVNCPRLHNSPLSDCPFCSAGKTTQAKIFVPVYNIDADQVQIWERGRKFFQKLSSICSRYASNTDLVSHIFDVERIGKKGETSTTYEIYEVDRDDTTLEDLPEQTEIIGGLVLDKSYEDMEYFVDNGYFPSDGEDVSSNRRGAEPERRESRRESGRRGDRY